MKIAPISLLILSLAAPALNAAPQTVSPSDSIRISNEPESFYDRPSLEDMPRTNYSDMPVINIKDLGATGNPEQIVNPYFDQAMRKLQEMGGGIIYIPKGLYRFEYDPTDPDLMITRGSETKQGDIWPGRKYTDIENLHFVGEGPESVLQFEFPGKMEDYSLHVGGLMFYKAKNVSLRDLSLTQVPFHRQRRGGNVKFGATFKAIDCQDFALTRVNVDQGQLGFLFNMSSGIWIVDCDVRNTVADNVKIDNCDDAHVLYSHFEEPMDDNISMIYYTRYRDTPSTGLYFSHNTILGPAFGRGVIIAGDQVEVNDNWVERCYGNGIRNYFGDIDNGEIMDNIMIRCGLANREGNLRPTHQEAHYSSTLSYSGSNGTIANNLIYGSAAVGLLLNGSDNLTFSNNYFEEVYGPLIEFGRSKQGAPQDIENSRFIDNHFSGNTEPVQFNATFKNVEASGNTISAPIEIGSNVSEAEAKAIKEGFVQSPGSDKYEDVYAFARKPDSQEADYPEASEILSHVEKGKVLNVRDFGATGDGKANDVIAIQKAIEALPESGGTIFFPAGDYHLTPVAPYDSYPFTQIQQHILVAKKKNIRIQGEGPQSAIHFDSLDHQGFRFIACENVVVDSLKLTTSATFPLRRNRAFIDLSGCHGALVQSVVTENGNGSAILVDTTDQAIIRNCQITDSNQYGIRIEGSCDVIVENNVITNPLDSAIHIGYSGSILRESNYIRVSRNQIEGSRGAGITVLCGKVDIIDNTVKNTYLSGLFVYQPAMVWTMNELEVKGNLFENCGEHPSHAAVFFSTICRRGDRGEALVEGNQFKNIPHDAVLVTFGYQIVYGTQGFKSFVVSDNSFENVAGEKVHIDKTFIADYDRKIQIDHLDIDNP